MKTAKLGEISSGTLRPEDLIETFRDALEPLLEPGDDWQHFATLLSEASDWLTVATVAENMPAYIDPENFAETGSELITQLSDALNDCAPSYCYFGSIEGDGACFGFWLGEEWQERAREDGALFVSDTGEIPADYAGEAFQISDHGNVTLYACDGKGNTQEVWSVV